MIAKHWQFEGTDVDFKDYGRDKANGIIHKVDGKFTLSMLPSSYVDHLTITDGSTVYTLYEYMTHLKGQ